MRSIYNERPGLKSVDLYFRNALAEFAHVFGLNEFEAFRRCVINHCVAHIETHSGITLSSAERMFEVGDDTIMPGLEPALFMSDLNFRLDKLFKFLTQIQKTQDLMELPKGGQRFHGNSDQYNVFYIPPKNQDQYGLFIIRMRNAEGSE